jgi:hypothetical protein
MARFSLFERAVSGDETFVSTDPPPPQNPNQRKPGDRWLIIERPLFNHRTGGTQRGTFSVVGTILRAVPNDDPLLAVNGTNRITGRGDISTQGLFRFSDFANPVIISIIGGTGDFKGHAAR